VRASFAVLLLCVPAGCRDAIDDGSGSASSSPASSWFDAHPAPPDVKVTCGDPAATTIPDSIGGGVGLFDADGDGDLDVLVIDPGPYPGDPGHGGHNRLFSNKGGRFADVTPTSGVDVGGFSCGLAIADVDSDGDRDIFLTRFGPNVLLENVGDLRFEPTPDAGGAAGDDWSTSAVFVDLDLDGDLDLYVANYVVFDSSHPPMHGVGGRTCLWREQVVYCGPQGLDAPSDRYYRNDDGRFVDTTEAAGFVTTPAFALGAIDGDFDQNGWPDVYVTNDSTPNSLFMNRGDGTVEEKGVLSGAALSASGREQAGMGLGAGDVNGDGLEDLFVTNFSNDENSLYISEGDGWFRDEALRVGLGVSSRTLLGWGAALIDVDLDGDLDAVALNGHVYPQADAAGTDTTYAQADRLWLNDGTGHFTLTPWPGDAPLVSRTLAVGDLDGDWVPDLFVLPLEGRPWIWRGQAPQERALSVVIDGPPGRVDGEGTEIVYESAGGKQFRRVRSSGGFQSASDPSPVFAWTGVGQLRLTFPGGATKTVDVDKAGVVRIDGGGS